MARVRILYLGGTAILLIVAIFLVLRFRKKHEPVKAPTSVYIAPSDNSGRVKADNSKMGLGIGFNSVTAEVREKCVDIPNAALPQPSGAGESFFNLTTTSDLNQLSEVLGVNAQVSLGFGVYSGDASVSYMSSGQFSRYSEYLAVTQRIEKERQLIDTTKVRLTGHAKDLLGQSVANFLAACGDQFISGQVQGGYLAATFRLSASTDAEQEQIRGSLSGSGPSGSVSVSMNKQMAEFRKQNRLEFSIQRQGPVEDWPQASIDSIIEYARTFPSKVKASGGAWTTHYLMTGYDELAGKRLLSDAQSQFFDRESAYIRTLYELRSGLIYIRDNPSQFGPFSSKRVDNDISSIEVELGRLKDLIRRCSANQSDCSSPQHMKLEDLPRRNSGADWKPVNVASNEKMGVAGSYENDLRAIEVKGRWYPNCPNKNVISNSVVMYFTNRKTGEQRFLPYPGDPVLIPAGYDVSVRVGDGPDPDRNAGIFLDNCSEDNNPVEARSFVPVFVDELRLAF
jgi:hypothetical protein